ncbi:Box C/D snoRNA accumulation [Dispira parvispora]|uniref:Box C/D snoRNA accumulation n=1 Tax=Dispira parvispora TaxID=1520584 RepID=A0A9W8E1D2_9FUNG|nr:Box C/D snoRNA accumulation [Dispira parvispora]
MDITNTTPETTDSLGSSSPPSNAIHSSCQICNTHPFKYKCPGCLVRTCSLACSQQHKKQSSCTGQRSKTHYLPLKVFTDNDLVSDFHFLQDGMRLADRSGKDNQGHHPKKFNKGYLSDLKRHAGRRGVKLAVMAKGMHRRKKNQSRWVPKREQMAWTVEFRFYVPGPQGPTELVKAGEGKGSSEVPTMDCVAEVTEHSLFDHWTWWDVLEKYWRSKESSRVHSNPSKVQPQDAAQPKVPSDPIAINSAEPTQSASTRVNHTGLDHPYRPTPKQLEKYAHILSTNAKQVYQDTTPESLVVLMRLVSGSSNTPTYVRLASNKSIHETLTNQHIIEYPTIHVYPNVPDHIHVVDPTS